MSPKRKPVIYVNGEPYYGDGNEIRPPEHALVEGGVDVMQYFMDVMIKPAENLGKAFKYLLKAITLSG